MRIAPSVPAYEENVKNGTVLGYAQRHGREESRAWMYPKHDEDEDKRGHVLRTALFLWVIQGWPGVHLI